MTKKPPKFETAKAPRTVQELTPWLNDQFGAVEELVQQANASRPIAEKTTTSAVTQSASQDPLRALLASLHQALTHLETLLIQGSPRPNEAGFAADARALILSGNGEKFEPCIRAAIREYCDARQEVFRCVRQTRLPEEVREDVLAGINRFLANRKQDLRLLGVTIEEVVEGSPLDLTRHQVVAKLTTERTDRLDTIRFCVTPVMTWKNPYGMERLEPARVVAFTTMKEPERSARERNHKPADTSPGVLFDPSLAFSPFDNP